MPCAKWHTQRSHLFDLPHFCIALLAFISCCENVMAIILQICSFQCCSRWAPPPPPSVFLPPLTGLSSKVFPDIFSQVLPTSFFLLSLLQLSESISPSLLSFRPQNQSSPADLSLPRAHMSRMYPNHIGFSSTALPSLHVSHTELS